MSATLNGFSLEPYFHAGYPAVAVETVEEERLTAAIKQQFPSKSIHRIAAVGGRQCLCNKCVGQRTKIKPEKGEHDDPACQYTTGFGWLAQQTAETILIVFDFQHMIKNAVAYRPLRDSFAAYKAKHCMVILVAPTWTLPPEMEREIRVLQYGLPSREELTDALDVYAEGAGITEVPDAAGWLDGASGLTLNEAESSFYLAGALNGGRDIVAGEKLRLINQCPYLEIFPPAPLDSMGGLGNLRNFALTEILPHKDNPLLRVRGLLFTGVQGGGKTLSAKVIGSMLGWPVVRADFSAMKGSLVGSSEANVHNTHKLLEAISPVVAVFDEVEKAMGGHASSAQSDSGVTLGMVGIHLTWSQEHTSPILSIMTSNDHMKLPPEMYRAGRVDKLFFVDLPTNAERPEIAAIHLKKFGWPVDLADHVSDITDGYTGAEIEQLCKSAARRSPTPSAEILTETVQHIQPLSRVRSKEIEALRESSKGIFERANTPEIISTAPARKLSRKS